MAKKINITAQLNAATTDGILADAGQIFDAKKGKFQEQVNQEFDEALEETITSEDTDMVVESIEEGIVHNALRKTEQILTEAEKEQARENIGVVSKQVFENEAVRVKKQVFTSEQKYQARHNISAITAEEAEKIAQDKINETSVSSPDKLQAVKELSSWLESNPDNAATMNEKISENYADIQRLYRGTGIDEYSQFSTGMDYAAGAVVLYDGVLFRFKADHAKGEWDYNEVEEWSEKKEREEKVSELGSKGAYLHNSIIGPEFCNIPNTMIVATGDLEGSESKWSNASASGYISCVGGSTLILTTESSTGSSGIAFYNKNKEVIVGYGKIYSKQTNAKIEIPLDAHFLRYTSFENESLSILFSNVVAENRNNLEDAIWYNTFAGTLTIDTKESTIRISNGYIASPKYGTSILANGETINYVLTDYSQSIIYLKNDGSLHFDSYGQYGTYNNKKELTDRILAVVRFASDNKSVDYVNHICQRLTINGIEYSSLGVVKKVLSNAQKISELEKKSTEEIQDIASEVAYLSNNQIGRELCTFANTMIVATGDSEGSESSWVNASASGYISCVGGGKLLLSTDSKAASSGIAFYDKDKNVIKGFGVRYNKQSGTIVSIPLNAYFLRFTAFENEGLSISIENYVVKNKEEIAKLYNSVLFSDEVLEKGIYWFVYNGVIQSQLDDKFGSIKSKLKKGESVIFSTKGGEFDARSYIWIPDNGDIVLSDVSATLENYVFTADDKGVLILNCQSEYYENFKYYKKEVGNKEDSEYSDIIYGYSDSFIDGYIYAATANLSIGDNIWDKEPTAFDGMGCAKIRIVKGDVVKLSIYGGSLARGYVITDIEGNVKEISTGSLDSVNGEKIVIEAKEHGFIYVNTYNKNEPQNVWVKINRKAIPTLIDCVKENNVNNGYYVVGDKIGETLAISAYPNDSFIHLDLVKVFSGDIVRLKAISGDADARAYALVDEESVCYEVAEPNTDYSVNEAVVNVRKDGYIMVSTKTIDNFRVIVERFENHREKEIVSRKYINAPYPYNNETMRVLVLGNSFCDDANSYLGELIENSGVDKAKLSIVVNIIGGSTFDVWINEINNNPYKNPYYVIGDYPMVNKGYIKDVIAQSWDVIVVQMGSDSSHIYSKYRSITDYLLLLRSLCTNQKVCIAFQPAWGRRGNNYMNEYKIYSEMTKRFVNEYGVDFIIPTNTALQYARETALKGEYNLVRDDRHLCLGVARYIAASMWFQTLISPVFNVGLKSITANHIVTAEEINAVKAIYGSSADVGATDVTDNNRALCQECVLKASVNMYIPS